MRSDSICSCVKFCCKSSMASSTMRRSMLWYFVFSLSSVLLASVAENEIVDDKHCIFRGNQSTHSLYVSAGDTAHMFCEVEFTDPSFASVTIPSMSRFPPRLKNAPPVDLSLTNTTTINNHIRVDLIVRHVTIEYDPAEYRLYINDCVCANVTLKVSEKCSSIPPKPANKTNFTVTASEGDSMVKLVANFTGEINAPIYSILLANATMDDLVRQTKKFSYEASQEHYANCVQPVVFVLHNVSVEDAGLYTARVTGPGYYINSSNRKVFFHLKVLESGFSNRTVLLVRILLPILSLTLCATVLAIFCIAWCVYGRWKMWCSGVVSPRPARNPQYAQLTTNRCSGVIILYDKVGRMRESLESFLGVLNPFLGHDLYIDILLSHYPANWTRWVQENLENRRHVVILCSENLHKAFNHSQTSLFTTERGGEYTDTGGTVEMFEGSFNAHNVINCIDPSKTVLVFLDRPQDRGIVPLPQLRDRKSFHLGLTHLLSVVHKDNRDDDNHDEDNKKLKQAITKNPQFREFKNFIQHLQT